MNLQAINNISMNIANNMVPEQHSDSHAIMIPRTISTPVTYPTLDGGLFVGYYLNIHG